MSCSISPSTSNAMRPQWHEPLCVILALPKNGFSRPSALQPIAGLENPSYYRQADQEKSQGHCQARPDAHVRRFIEAPAETADQIDYGIEQSDRAPRGRQHVD